MTVVAALPLFLWAVVAATTALDRKATAGQATFAYILAVASLVSGVYILTA